MPTVRNLVLFVLAVAAGLCLPNCAAKPAGKKAGKNVTWSMRRSDDNAYLAGRVKDKEGANSVLVLPRDLRPPFRCETRAGVFDDRRRDGVAQPSIFGMELDTPGRIFPPPQFYFISCQLFPGGLSVYSGSHLTVPNTAGATFFDGAAQADLAIEHDGENVLFFARAAGTEQWTALGSVDAVGQPFPVHPTVGIFNGRRGGEVGFDDFRVLANGPRPGGASAGQTVIEDLWEVLDLQAEVAHALDGAAPDRGAASTALDRALTDVDAVAVDLDALAEPGKKSPEQLAARRLRSGRKQLASALAKLDKGKSAKTISKKLEKAVTLQFRAIFELQNAE